MDEGDDKDEDDIDDVDAHEEVDAALHEEESDAEEAVAGMVGSEQDAEDKESLTQ